MERISADTGSQFTLTDFKEECQTCGVHLTLAAPEHKKMNGQVKVTWITLRTIEHSLMVNARILEAYINFALMYTIDHIFLVIPIKDLINEDGNPTTPHKLATGKNLQCLNYACLRLCLNVLRSFMYNTQTK